MAPDDDVTNILTISSSKLNENSYSYGTSRHQLGVALIDRFTHFTVNYLQNIQDITFRQLFKLYNKKELLSTVDLKTDWPDIWLDSAVHDYFRQVKPKKN